eukprot:355066-Chlamydomonas_euryale.AAC.7
MQWYSLSNALLVAATSIEYGFCISPRYWRLGPFQPINDLTSCEPFVLFRLWPAPHCVNHGLVRGRTVLLRDTGKTFPPGCNMVLAQ